MDDVHRFIGYSVPTAFAILALWVVYSLIRNRPPHDAFWSLLGGVQVVIGVQVIVGGVLFLTGARPQSNGPSWLHYVYGALFPAAVLTVAHRYAKKWEGVPYVAFGIAGFLCFGLTFRALQTGLGID